MLATPRAQQEFQHPVGTQKIAILTRLSLHEKQNTFQSMSKDQKPAKTQTKRLPLSYNTSTDFFYW